MLSFTNISDPNEIKRHVDQFNSQNSTWIVSDLKSKLDIQNKCLNKDGFFLDDSILRVSDFWRLWLRRLSPDLAVVSSDFIKILVQNFIHSEQFKELELEPHQHSTVYRYLNELAPVILSPQSDEIIQDWMKTKDKTWYKWYLIARLCLNDLVQEKKIIDGQWIPSFIQNLDLNLLRWDKHIYLDLGSEMTSVEMGIFQFLSKKVDVTVFVPNPEWKDKYRYLLNTYTTHSGYSAKSNSAPVIKDEALNLSTYKRFATEALEIKYIVSQVRSWIDEGIKPVHIGLMSPRVEEYWPVLKIHLDAEGIPYNKKNVASMLSLGCFQLLISKIKSLSTDVTWETLEQSYYGETEETQHLEYEKFKAQFLELTDADDLLRQEDIKKIFYNKMNLKDRMKRLPFLAVVFKTWADLNLSENSDVIVYLEVAFKDFLSRTTDLELNLEQWLTIFSAGVSKKEVTIDKSNSEGIDIGSSNSSHLFNVQNMIWFGLDDSGFKKNSSTMIPLPDIEELKYEFDFPLNYPEESHTEFNIRWLSNYNFKQQIFTCSLFNSKAEPLNTSPLILEYCLDPDVDFEIEVHGTRVDSLQLVHKTEGKIDRELQALDVLVPDYKPSELSITDFINYDHCAFKLLAAKGFKLKDYPVVSIDLDPRQRGSVTHALFEYLVTDKKYQNHDVAETSTFLDTLRLEYKLYVNMDDFWLAQKKKLIETAVKFSQFENQRLEKSPVQHLIELDFKLKLHNISVNGRIDRVDVYSDQTSLIYDYKRSESDTTNYGVNWMDKREFQMLFYMLALQDTLNMKDQGAYYFFYKNMDVFKGILSQAAAESFEIHESIQPRKKAVVSEEAYQNLKQEFKNYIFELEQKLYSGVYTARPYKVEICASCDWNTLCRAPHL
jgi:ATP-dependent helicase/nuclease subunit B